MRKPGWCEGGYRILVNGESHEGRANDRGYINLELSFSEGTELEIEFPFRLRYLKTPDMPRLAAIQAGPYILAAPGEQREFLKQPADEGQLNQILKRPGDFCIRMGRNPFPSALPDQRGSISCLF